MDYNEEEARTLKSRLNEYSNALEETITKASSCMSALDSLHKNTKSKYQNDEDLSNAPKQWTDMLMGIIANLDKGMKGLSNEDTTAGTDHNSIADKIVAVGSTLLGGIASSVSNVEIESLDVDGNYDSDNQVSGVKEAMFEKLEIKERISEALDSEEARKEKFTLKEQERAIDEINAKADKEDSERLEGIDLTKKENERAIDGINAKADKEDSERLEGIDLTKKENERAIDEINAKADKEDSEREAGIDLTKEKQEERISEALGSDEARKEKVNLKEKERVINDINEKADKEDSERVAGIDLTKEKHERTINEINAKADKEDSERAAGIDLTNKKEAERSFVVNTNKSNLNVRTESGEIIESIPKGTNVKVVGQPDSKGYVKVEYGDGKTGYVYQDYLKPKNVPQSIAKGVVNTQHSGLNMRTSPDASNNNIIGSLPKGSEINIIGESDDGYWYKILYDDRELFVSKKYVEEVLK